MTDTENNSSTFRSKVENVEVKEIEPVKKEDQTVQSITEVVPPYTAYEQEKNRPYLVDLYELGDTWREKLGGFESEILSVDRYIKDKISNKGMSDSVEAVKKEVQRLEELCGVSDTDRQVIKLRKLSAYADFLLKTAHFHE